MINDVARIKVEAVGRATVLRFLGEIDVSNADMLGRALGEELPADAHSIVIDLGGVDYLDSAGMRLLLVTAAEVHLRNARIVIVCPPSSKIRKVIEIAGIQEVAPIMDSVGEAVSSLE